MSWEANRSRHLKRGSKVSGEKPRVALIIILTPKRIMGDMAATLATGVMAVSFILCFVTLTGYFLHRSATVYVTLAA